MTTDPEIVQAALDRVAPGGFQPEWLNNEGDVNEADHRCDVWGLPDIEGTRCKRDRAWIAWIGCEHEHLQPSDVCDSHIAQVRLTKFRCELCKQADGHTCLAPVIRVDPAPETLPPPEDPVY